MTLTWDWTVIAYAAPSMLRGAWLTIQLSLASMFFATIIGAVLSLVALANFRLLRFLVAAYVYIMRGMPTLPFIFLLYYALPATGIYLSPIWAGVLALSISAGAYVTEIFRAGLLSVDTGQTEAATAIGMTRWMTLTSVLLPQAVKRVIPPLCNELILVIKTTSLLSVITISELTRSAQIIVLERFTPFEIYAALAIFYLVIVTCLSLLMRYVEWRLAQ